MKMKIGNIISEGCTIKGQKREENQDSFMLNDAPAVEPCIYISAKKESQYSDMLCYAVADGVSSAPGAARASKILLGTINRLVDRYADWRKDNPESDEESYIIDVINECNQRIVSESMSTNSALVTTLSALFLVGRRYIFVNLGDSPAVLLRQNKKTILSKEHTLGELKREKGEEASDRDDNMLTSYIGLEGFIERRINITTGTLRNNDIFLLWTDGASDYAIEVTSCSRRNVPSLKNWYNKNLKKKRKDDSTVVKVLINEVSTDYLQDKIENEYTESGFIRTINDSSGNYESWRDIISAYCGGDLRTFSRQLKTDWCISKPNDWIKKKPEDRDKVIKMCISLGLEREAIDVVLKKALMSPLDFNNSEKDIIWSGIIGRKEEMPEDYTTLKDWLEDLEKAIDNSQRSISVPTQMLKKDIESELEKEGVNVYALWSGSPKADNVGKYINAFFNESREKGGETKIPRAALIALALKTGRSLDELKRWLEIAGHSPLRSKNLFEATLSFYWSDFSRKYPSLFWNDNRDMQDRKISLVRISRDPKTKDSETTGEDIFINDIIDDLDELMIAKLTAFRDKLPNAERPDFKKKLDELIKYTVIDGDAWFDEETKQEVRI